MMAAFHFGVQLSGPWYCACLLARWLYKEENSNSYYQWHMCFSCCDKLKKKKKA